MSFLANLKGVRTFIAVIASILVTGNLAGMLIMMHPPELFMSNILALGGMLTSTFGVIIGSQAYKSVKGSGNGSDR